MSETNPFLSTAAHNPSPALAALGDLSRVIAGEGVRSRKREHLKATDQSASFAAL